MQETEKEAEAQSPCPDAITLSVVRTHAVCEFVLLPSLFVGLFNPLCATAPSAKAFCILR